MAENSDHTIFEPRLSELERLYYLLTDEGLEDWIKFGQSIAARQAKEAKEDPANDDDQNGSELCDS